MKQRSFFKSGRNLMFCMLAGLMPLTVTHAEDSYNQGQGMQERGQYGSDSSMPSEPRGAQGPMRSETMSSEQFAERQRDMQRIQLRDEQSRKELSHLPFWKEYQQLNNKY